MPPIESPAARPVAVLPRIAEADLPPVLITGGAGYVGSHAALALLDRGARVVIVDDLSTGSDLLVPPGATFVQGRAGDQALIADTIAAHGIGAIMHFAASISVSDSVSEPAFYYRNNVGETLALGEVAAKSGIGALVFSSTAAVYGEREGAPLKESDPIAPINPYGWSKVMGEQILRDIVSASALRDGKLSVGILRYFNVSGADPQGRSGQNSHHPHHLIEIASHVATGLRPSFTVFGNNYATPDGTGIRDYVHVSDIAEAHVLMLRACLATPRQSHVFNLGYGKGHSVLDVLDALGKAAGHPLPYTFGPRRAGDPGRLVADASAAAALEWVPKFDDIEVIVAHALAWEKARQQRAA
jgi:UDP-glucose 4-epimerase